MKWYYAIEIIGYRTKRRFVIKDVMKEGNSSYHFHPVNGGRPFRTEEGARRFASEKGYEIEVIGDLYDIMI